MRIYGVLLAAYLILGLLSPPLSQGAEAGKDLFASRCQGCHGADGKGNQTMAKALQTNIPDLTSKNAAKRPEKEILEVISKGKGKMPPSTGLSDKDLKELAAHVKGISKGK